MSLFNKKKQVASTPTRRRYSYSATGVAQDKQTQQRDRSAVQFKRGRTLAGSTRSRVRASETTALQTATPREKAHHLARVRRKIIGMLVIVAIGLLSLLVLLWQFSAGVTVQLSDVPLRADTQQYEQTIQTYLKENPPERLRFNLNDERLTEFVARKHTEVESITQGGYSSLAHTVFSVKLRKPVVSWQVSDARYFVDEHGVSFTKNLYETPLVTIVDNSGVRYTPGTAIASERFLGFVGRTVALAHKNKLAVTSVSIPPGTSHQVELIAEGVSYPIILSIDRSPAEQVEDALRAVQHFKVTGKSPAYIDLRVKGRAFFRD